MNDYQRIAEIIRFLDGHHREQPTLEVLADRAKLSRFHFHRLFSTWAGITPKDFLQCLTLAHAKELLKKGENILDAALDSGLSGPGRLHDLCVSLEAASPGELKSGGAGWTIAVGFADTPFGTCLIASGPRGICNLAFVDSADEQALAQVEETWPLARVKRDDASAGRLAQKIFCPARDQRRATLRAFIKGTPFQVRVWRALLRIPSGTLVTYGNLAASLGQPTAARAVGSAVAKNTLAYLIPCHRVIRETGVIGEYRWGPIRKRAILAWESGAKV
jgi:AraC family transcriptional regulator, regulatory protein of adaptative response / methylated-DNA-[protein]-cysteine methyltransferase